MPNINSPTPLKMDLLNTKILNTINAKNKRIHKNAVRNPGFTKIAKMNISIRIIQNISGTILLLPFLSSYWFFL